MKSIRISIEQLQNLADVAKANADRVRDNNGIICIELEEESDSHNRADKLSFRLESSYAECNGTFLGTN